MGTMGDLGYVLAFLLLVSGAFTIIINANHTREIAWKTTRLKQLDLMLRGSKAEIEAQKQEIELWRKSYGDKRIVHLQRNDYLWLTAMRCTSDMGQVEALGEWWYFRFTSEEYQKFANSIVELLCRELLAGKNSPN